MHWVSILVLGLRGAPMVAAMRWWTTRGPLSSDRRTEERRLLQACAQTWGRSVLHVWDRGFAGGPWLAEATRAGVRFVQRWQKGYKLIDAQGQKRQAWQVTRGKRSLDHRLIWDARRQCHRRTGLYFCPVAHPDHPGPLWQVVSRPGKGRSPWYLLTDKTH